MEIAQSSVAIAEELKSTSNQLQDEEWKGLDVAEYRIVNASAVPLELYGN